jgi:hypothetical protein
MASAATVLAGPGRLPRSASWVADAPPQVMAALGIRRDPLTSAAAVQWPGDDRDYYLVSTPVRGQGVDAPAGGREPTAGNEH